MVPEAAAVLEYILKLVPIIQAVAQFEAELVFTAIPQGLP